jgi:MFS family permease
VGLALVVDTFGVQNVGEKAGYALSSSTLGVISGPVLGGAVYEHAGYNAVVGMMIGLVAMDILLRLIMVEKKIAVKWQDTPATEEPPSNGRVTNGQRNKRNGIGTFNSSDTSTRVGEGAGSSQEDDGRSEDGRLDDEEQPLLQNKPLTSKRGKMPPIYHLIKSPRIIANIYAVFISYVLLASFDSDLALFVKETFKWESTGAGLIYLTIALPSLLSPIAGSLSDRFGARWFAAGGFAGNFVFVTLLRLVIKNTTAQIVLLCCLMTLIGNLSPFIQDQASLMLFLPSPVTNCD